MNDSQIIREISTLSPDEQAKVVRFAYSLDAERRTERARTLRPCRPDGCRH